MSIYSGDVRRMAVLVEAGGSHSGTLRQIGSWMILRPSPSRTERTTPAIYIRCDVCLVTLKMGFAGRKGTDITFLS